MIKAIVFDLDDTLYKEHDFVFDGFRQVSEYLNRKYEIGSDILYGDMIEIFYREGRGRIFDSLCSKYDLPENVDDLVKVYRENKPNIELYEDAIKLLSKIKDRYFLGIITDGKSFVQWNKIKALGLEDYIDKIIVTDDKGLDYWKPSEEPYRDILEYFNVIAEELIYIGDNPKKDFISAKRLGINTIRIIRPTGDHMNTYLSKEYEANYNIKSLLELEDIINLLNEKS
ncbi:MAG: HAD family hydrolase [Tissierellaceae bacterium]